MQFLRISWLLISYLLFINVPLYFAMPLPQGNVESNFTTTGPGASVLIPFLKKFGYLEDKSIGTSTSTPSDHEMLYTDDSVEDAIKEMQKFGALKQSGKLDDETIALLTKPRCGIPDVLKANDRHKRSKRYVIGATGWNKRQISYRVENWTPQLSESTVLSDIRKAFAVWADYARLRFISRSRDNRDDADISISFGSGYHGDTYPFDGPGGVLAHAFFPYGHGSLGGDIHFDVDENWSSNTKVDEFHNHGTSTYNVSFLAVAVHEIGHSLGLSHSPLKDSVMFPYYQGTENGNEPTQLGYDDIMAMYRLYIQREIHDYGDTNRDDPSTTTTEPSTSTNSLAPSSTTTTYDITTRTSENSPVQPTTEVEKTSPKPDLCKDEVDSITFLRNEIFVFNGKYMWRFKERGVTEHYYPVEMSRLFPMLADTSKIDAAVENNDGKILFFSGKYYWIFDEAENPSSAPSPITDFGLPAELQKVDAVFIWGKNEKLYFFSGKLFWRYNTSIKRMDDGYPKGIERWQGLPLTGIDSAMKWSDGKTYFFKNNEFWRFDDAYVKTDNGYPMKTSSYWFGC